MGAWQEIVDFTFTANETSRTFSGLSITEDDFVRIDINLVNNSASDNAISLFPNTTDGVSGHDTVTNYHRQVLLGTGSSVVAARANNAQIHFAVGSQTSFGSIYFKISENGKTNWFANRLDRNDSSLVNIFDYTTSSNLTFNDPITSLTFTSNQTNGIGTDSRIQIYKLAATKVADITVSSNTTQVDISSLSIDKDSEYLLVSDMAVGASITDLYLMVNGNTTLADYYSQRINAFTTTAAASRINNARFGFMNTGEPYLAYSHIKLSNIGAYTSQSYGMQAATTSNVSLRNDFVSSTSEAITSITAINIRSSNANSIGAGSRFHLYKLYE